MQIDELRGELTTLADEMTPFTGDVQSLHRRQRRRRIVTSSIAVVLVVAVGIAAAALTSNGPHRRVEVSNPGAKEVPSTQITSVDAIVLPANDAVRRILDSSSDVVRYADIPKSIAVDAGTPAASGGVLHCVARDRPGFAVVGTGPAADVVANLKRDLGAQATVTDVSDSFGYDIEVFMKVGASNSTVQSIRRQLEFDSDVESFQTVTQDDAYAIFKHDFAAQPALIQSTKPSDLPASFRIALKPGVSESKVVQRYAPRAGVDSSFAVGDMMRKWLFHPDSTPPPANASAGFSTSESLSLCTKP